MRDSVPSARYSSVYNVLRLGESRSSLLIESADSMINIIFLLVLLLSLLLLYIYYTHIVIFIYTTYIYIPVLKCSLPV